MSCDHQLIATHAGALLDGSLPESLRERCQQVIADCEHCQSCVAQAKHYAAMAAQWQNEPVPNWNRARHLVKPHAKPSPVWLSWSALAASLMSVVLVLTRAEISTQNGFVISFGGSLEESRVQQLIASEVAVSAASQTSLLDTRLADFAARQLDANRLLLADWDEANRLERRQELGLLFSGWQNQRQQDQRTYAARFNELQSDQLESNVYLNSLMQTVALLGRSGL